MTAVFLQIAAVKPQQRRPNVSATVVIGGNRRDWEIGVRVSHRARVPG
jgi:hypothetical protein